MDRPLEVIYHLVLVIPNYESEKQFLLQGNFFYCALCLFRLILVIKGKETGNSNDHSIGKTITMLNNAIIMAVLNSSSE